MWQGFYKLIENGIKQQSVTENMLAKAIKKKNYK